MGKLKSNMEKLVDGLHKITGIRKSAIKDYADKNNIFDIIDHPMIIGATDKRKGREIIVVIPGRIKQC